MKVVRTEVGGRLGPLRRNIHENTLHHRVRGVSLSFYTVREG